MEWRNPIYWTAGWIAALAWLTLVWWSVVRSNRRRERFAPGPMQSQILSPRNSRAAWGSGLLQAIALLLAFLSLAGPQFGESEQRVESRSNDLYVLLDVSRSMMATDVLPSRLERAKADIASLVNRLEGERIGLIVFAGQAVIQSPLTVDYENFKHILASVDPFSAPRGGTAIGDAIRKSTEILSQTPTGRRSILLVSDGGDLESSPVEAAALAAEKNIPIHAIGLGDSRQGARIPTGDIGGFVEYNGEQIWSKLEPALLEDISKRTKGRFFSVETRAMDMATFYSEFLADSKRGAGDSQIEMIKAERYQWFLGASLGCLLLVPVLAPSHRISIRHPRPKQPWNQKAPVLALALFSTLTSNVAIAESGEVLKPSDAFARAYVEQTNGNWEEAIGWYEQASRSSDDHLVSAAQFNLGKLYLDQIPSEIKPGVLPVSPEERKRLETLALLAVDSFANSLELSPGKQSAKQALFATKQWIANAKEAWRLEDLRAKYVKLGSLGAIQEIANAQLKSLHESQQARTVFEPAVYAQLARKQRDLLEESTIVQQLLREDLIKGEQTDAPKSSAESNQEALEIVDGYFSEIHGAMVKATEALNAFSAVEAESSQLRGIQGLESLWNLLAPYEALLGRALDEQGKLVQDMESSDPISADLSRERWVQRETWNRNRTGLLAEKASQALDSQQNPDSERATAPDSSYLEKAVSVGPQAAEAMRAALNHALSREASNAKDKAAEALRLLKELVPPQDPSSSENDPSKEKESPEEQDSSKKNESSTKGDSSTEGNSSDNGETSDTEKKSQEKGETEGEKENEENNPDRKQPPNSSEGKSTAPNSSLGEGASEEGDRLLISPERLDELLRKVREREVEKRIRDKRWRERIYGRRPVERDW